MSELETQRDHFRALANWEPPKRPTKRSSWCRVWFGQRPVHANCPGVDCGCGCHPEPEPPSDSDRALAKRLAGEIDAYLAGDRPPAEGDGLWEDQ